MFTHQTYQTILNRVLSRVETNVDKREGSVIYDAIAPACAELAEMYIELDNILNLTFAETSYGEYLDKRAAEMGVHRKQATKAKRLGLMYKSQSEPLDIPIGTRFSLQNEVLFYIVTERLETGKYFLECETEGSTGNHFYGRLIPVEHVKDLIKAELSEVLIPGEETETDESLYKRYYETVNAKPYGGNIDDYRRNVNAIDGVGDCRVIPVYNGGGTVKVIIISSEYGVPSNTLVDTVKKLLDPVPNTGQGMGIAPIGHKVTVEPAQSLTINIQSKIILRQGISLGQVEEEIRILLEAHFLDLRKGWSQQDTVVRISIINSIILQVKDVLDVEETLLNQDNKNISLNMNEVCYLGGLVLNA